MKPIAISTHGGAASVPRDTRLRLTGQRLESTAPRSQVGPGPLHPHTIVLTTTAIQKIRQHGHTGDWLLSGSYGSIILIRPHPAPGGNTPAPNPKAMPTPPGVLMQRPLWTTFQKESVISCYDGPRALLKKDRNGQDYLALWQDETPFAQRWLHIPLNPQALRETLAGALPLRQAIKNADFIFFVDEDSDGNPLRTVMTVPAYIPAHHPVREAFPRPEGAFSCPPQVADHWLSGQQGPDLPD